jgi:hypothetical protein
MWLALNLAFIYYFTLIYVSGNFFINAYQTLRCKDNKCMNFFPLTMKINYTSYQEAIVLVTIK